MSDPQQVTDEDSPYLYWAFISYSSKDKKWARWLHRSIETYGIPAQLVSHPTPVGVPAPRRFHPLFHDRAELPASSDLGIQIERALRQSRYLIVVCSPCSAQSKWVNKEIETFQRLHRHGRILTILVDGEPHAGGTKECFAPALRSNEPIAADARPQGDGKIDAKLKLLAGMLGVSFDALKRREASRQIRRLQKMVAVALLLVITFAGLTWYANHQRERAIHAREGAERLLAFLVYDMRGDLEAVGRLDLAQKVKERVDEYYRQVGAESALPVTLHNRAAALDNEGDILRKKGDLAGALRAYSEALETTQVLIKKEPSNIEWQRDLTVSLVRLGDIKLEQGDSSAARKIYEEIVQISEKLVVNSKADVEFQRDFGANLERLGDAQMAQGDLTGAQATFEKRRKLIEKMVAGEPGNPQWEHDLIMSCERLGDLALEKSDMAGARTNYIQGQRISEKLLAGDPSHVERQRDFARSLEKLGNLQFEENDLGGAQARYEKSVKIVEKLTAGDPSNGEWQRDLNVSLNKLGDILFFAGDIAGAQAKYEQGWRIAERLVAINPANLKWQHDLSFSSAKKGNVKLKLRDLPGALADYKLALEIDERLAASDPKDAEFQRYLFSDYFLLAGVTGEARSNEALDWWRKASTKLSELKESGIITSPEIEPALRSLRERIEMALKRN